MTTLIVQLPPRNTAIQAAQWQLGALPFALFDRRARMLRAGCATLTLLPRAQTTILLIAARDLLLLSVPLAPLSKARLGAVLPNVVEDQLAQDAQSCHIALEPMPARQSASRPKPACTRRVAIIDRDWFRFIHMAFTEAGHLRLRAAPITSCLPDAEADSETPAWRVLAYDSAPQDSGPPLIELALARGAHAEGLSVSADALAVSLAAVIMDAPAALYQLNRAPAHALEHFSVDLPLARARRQYGDRCGRSRFRRAQRDGCDPAAIPNAENAEATQGKSLKNALAARRLRIRCLYAKARWRRVICKTAFAHARSLRIFPWKSKAARLSDCWVRTAPAKPPPFLWWSGWSRSWPGGFRSA